MSSVTLKRVLQLSPDPHTREEAITLLDIYNSIAPSDPSAYRLGEFQNALASIVVHLACERTGASFDAKKVSCLSGKDFRNASSKVRKALEVGASPSKRHKITHLDLITQYGLGENIQMSTMEMAEEVQGEGLFDWEDPVAPFATFFWVARAADVISEDIREDLLNKYGISQIKFDKFRAILDDRCRDSATRIENQQRRSAQSRRSMSTSPTKAARKQLSRPHLSTLKRAVTTPVVQAPKKLRERTSSLSKLTSPLQLSLKRGAENLAGPDEDDDMSLESPLKKSRTTASRDAELSPGITQFDALIPAPEAGDSRIQNVTSQLQAASVRDTPSKVEAKFPLATKAKKTHHKSSAAGSSLPSSSRNLTKPPMTGRAMTTLPSMALLRVLSDIASSSEGARLRPGCVSRRRIFLDSIPWLELDGAMKRHLESSGL